MDEAVVGAALGASIQIVLQNLLSISLEEIRRHGEFKKDLEKLRSSFLMVRDFLGHAEMTQGSNNAVKRWLRNLEAVAFDADNVFDELNYEVLRRKTGSRKKMKNKVTSFVSHSNPLLFRRRMAKKIRDINKNLEDINQQASSFGLQYTTLPGAHNGPGAGSEMETASLTVDPIVLGREDDVSRIVEILTTASSDEQHFDAKILFKNILASSTTEIVELGTKEALLRKLQQALGDERYLLVLDDVWNEDREKWDEFINSLAGISSKRGNGIIVTTRSVEVASIVKTLPFHHDLKTLSEDDCWSIIKEKAFGEGVIQSTIEIIGRTIAKRCQGLPLAAKVVGSLLRGRAIDDWISIEKNWFSKFGEEDNVSKILKLSFDHLSLPSLKKCFAYCSVFPKGFNLGREELIEHWMAEGFLQTDQENDMEIMGGRYFNRLLQSFLLQSAERDDYGNVTRCSMHDLVHDLADSILSNTIIANNLDGINQVRYISLQSIIDESLPISREHCMCLRTLFYNDKVSDILISSLKSLHVLVLRCDYVEELPSSIKELIHLRYFDVSYTRITHLPDSVGELYHLQTLRAVKEENGTENYLKKLPNTLKYIISLRHLHIPLIELPPEIGHLVSLQTLQYFPVGDGKNLRIVQLGSLKNLKGDLEIDNLEKVHDKEEAKRSCLFQKLGLSKLKFVWNENRTDEVNDENVLEGLQPHPNLKSLEILGFRRFPLWTLQMAVEDDLEGRWVGLTNLVDIKLYNCRECEEIPMLGHLPHLKFLFLDYLPNVRSIGSSFYGIDKCRKSVGSSNNGVHEKTIIYIFPVLEELHLFNMPNLTEWVEVELVREAETQQCEVVFPCLQSLQIRSCRQLMSAPSHFPCLKDLDIDEMGSGMPLASICGKLISLTSVTIANLEGLESLPIGLFYCNKDLRQLKVESCPNLRELPINLRYFHYSLEELCIESCPNLKSIPYQNGRPSQGFSSLSKLKISDCEGLTSLPIKMIASCALSIETLKLYRLSSLTNLPMVLGCLHKMHCLRELSVVDVPKLYDSSEVEMAVNSLQSLQVLNIGYSADWRDIRVDSFKLSILNGFFLGGVRYSLRILRLGGMEHWDSLPDHLQHLTALSELWLYGFGIEALPEWLGNMSSLKELSIKKCKKLSLPSKEAMQRLTKLTHIGIFYCPLLGEQIRYDEQQSVGGFEFSKISHISTIRVDYRRIQSRHH